MSHIAITKSLFLLCLFLALSAIGFQGLAGQSATTDSLPRPVASAGSRIGPIGDEIRSVHGGWLGVGLSPSTVVGGGGFGTLGPITVQTSSTTEIDLEFGYAGIIIERRRSVFEHGTLAGRILTGAGHASVRPVGGASEIGADNFVVVEGALALGWFPLSHLELGAGMGYRKSMGVDDLEGIRSEDLSGVLLSLDISFRGR